MTREDKDAIIRRLEAMYGETGDNETKEALFYSVEALKIDIDIQDAYEQGYTDGWKERFGEPERPHGEWVEHRQFYSVGCFYSEYECSNCHDDVWQKTEWQFCPNCGASMVKEGEDK